MKRADRSKSPSARLEKQLGPGRLAPLMAVATLAASRRAPAFVVGGAVRDALLGRAVGDVDIVVEGDAIALGRALVRAHGGRLVAHHAFRTAKWFLHGSVFEIADGPAYLDLITARHERYARPAALPVVTPGSLHDDLGRRDFTINTLALGLGRRHFGGLIDECGGLADLRRKHIRVLHPLSFVDDPTRMLRAVRYEQRYEFQIEAGTLAQLEGARPLVGHLSHKRVRGELDRMLEEPRADAMLGRLHALGLLREISGALPWDAAVRRRLKSAIRRPPPVAWAIGPLGGVPLDRALRYAVWLAFAAPSAVADVQERLQLPKALLETVLATGALIRDLPGLEQGAAPSAWVERLDGVPVLAIYAAYLCAGAGRGKPLQTYVLKWRHIGPATNGDALRKLGLPPSRAYQTILRRLRQAWLDGQITSTAEEQLLLQSLLAEL